jgi:hypothetical protein
MPQARAGARHTYAIPTASPGPPRPSARLRGSCTFLFKARCGPQPFGLKDHECPLQRLDIMCPL